MKNRKTMVLTLIAVSTLLVLIVGATFAYFSASNSASGSTTVTTTNETIGSVIVTNPTENLHLKLSSYDMQEANKGTSYYATENSEESHSKGKENNVIAKYSITGGEQSTVYNCSFNMSVNKPSEIQEGDMTLKFTGIGAKINGLSSVSVDLAKADSTYQVTFSRVGNGIGNLVVGDITFNNTETEQNYLEDTTLNASVTLSGMECEIETTEEPDLFDGTLTPVVYDGDNWKIVESTDKDWYDYENQEWANAVILESSSTKTVGDTVSVEGSDPDVLATYVWIPRYEYKIEGKYGNGGTSTTNLGAIDVNFISKETIKASDGYMVHPAFTLGGEELSGIWVGKFEISHTTSPTTALGCTSNTCSEGNNLRILPNAQSLKSNTVSNFYYGIKSMEQSDNVFGIDSNTTDSHMIKNSEWGAVAYLSQSTYGKYGNDDYEGRYKEVFINNSKGYTGRSSGSYGGNLTINAVYTDQTSTAKYNNTGFYTYDGYLLEYNTNTKTTTRDMNKVASTTGNITGVYDMSGGLYDYVMGVYEESTGEAVIASAGFSDLPNEKYFNRYNSGTGTVEELAVACNNGTCYGEALNETASWNGDNITSLKFGTSSKPWAIRGGQYGDGGYAGLYYIASFDGAGNGGSSSRAVLTSKSSLTEEYKIYENGEVVYFDVETGLKCTNYNEENSKTGYNGIDNRTGSQNSCLKFYAFNDNGGNTVNLILDHNTTATSLWNSNGDNSTGPTDVITNLNNDTKDWKGTIEPANYTTGVTDREYTVNYEGLNARLLTANETAIISGNIGWYENLSGTDKYYFDTKVNTKSTTCQEGDITGCRYGWLYDRTNIACTNTGCLNNSDTETEGYWTASASTTNSTAELHQEYCSGNVNYGVSDSGRLSIVCPNYPDYYGVRPVIEVNKNDLDYTYNNICTLADDSTVAAGEYGAKYNCKVDPNKDAYTFYLLGNNEDGTSDLIMSHNINASGEEVIPNESSDLGMVAWYADDYDNSFGPTTAMTYLHNATKSWTNVEPISYTYNDKEVQASEYGYTSFKSTNGIAVITGSDGTSTTIGSETEPLRARMPVYTSNSAYSSLSEVSGKTSTNEFLYNNLDSEYINGPYGYWTLSSYPYDSGFAWGVYADGIVDDGDVNYDGSSGVRPVITVIL